MLNSLRRALNAQSLALWTAGISATGNTTLALLTGLDVRLGYFLLLAAVTSGALAVAGPGAGGLIAYVAASGLCGISLWAGLLPTAAVVLGRVVRRARMLSQTDATAPKRGGRPGVWGTLQAWAGWEQRR
ncbi:hypothetical protein SAM9427_36965 (plasmid) [Streptomyces sp. ETH9427]|uniref:hypothetical protein n=1 Tax=Streptomyces sp. E1N211 TaxID=1851876 RepID=UPI000E0B0119|nr:hypothetical protein [Streptomyces sp. E1N211]AXI91360.1 hypothetical protein SAM9427_36965 [Streptomyces sp. ETH9427]